MTFSGKYRFNTQGCGVPEAVFLYKKLQLETRPFVYRSESRSWQITKTRYFVDGNGVDGYIAFELPDNTGDYESLEKARLRQRKADRNNAPCVKKDEGDGEGEDSREILVLWVFRSASISSPYRMAMGSLSGFMGDTSGHPWLTNDDYISDGISPILKTVYAFFDADTGGVGAKGFTPYLSVKDSIFCHNCPPEVRGKISYSLSVAWQREAYKSGIEYGSESYSLTPGGSGYSPEFEGYTNWNDFFRLYEGEPYKANLQAIFQPTASMGDIATLNSCGSSNLDGWWLTSGTTTGDEYAEFNGFGGNTAAARDEFIVWKGAISDYPAWLSYMELMLSYWGVLNSSRAVSNLLGSMALNRDGSGVCVEDAGGSYPPDTSSVLLIASAEYSGRYCDVILNYQKNGVVKELTLPIDFPTRVTHVSYDLEEFYDVRLPQETEGQRIEEPYLAEWFSGRVNIDKNNIYVDIVYEIIREYEEGLQVYPNKSYYQIDGTGDNEIRERPGIVARHIGLTSTTGEYDETTHDCLLSQPGEQIFARALRDKFNKTIRYTIEKSSFTITNTEEFVGSHSTEKGLFTDNFLKHNTILNISQQASFRQYNTTVNNVTTDVENPVILTPSTERIGYLGLPTPYFQLDCRPSLDSYGVEVSLASPFWLDPGTPDYSAMIVNDFLTLRTDWNDVYWVFYLMMERPFLNKNNPDKLIDFKDRSIRKGAGYKKNSNYYYLAYDRFPRYDDYAKTKPISPGFFEAYIEHERLRGYPLIKDGRIKKWLRIAPNSFPLFEPGGDQS